MLDRTADLIGVYLLSLQQSWQDSTNTSGPISRGNFHFSSLVLWPYMLTRSRFRYDSPFPQVSPRARNMRHANRKGGRYRYTVIENPTFGTNETFLLGPG